MNEDLKDTSEDSQAELCREKLKNERLLKKLENAQYRLSQYEEASEGAREGLWARDLVDNRVFISPPWARMLGYTTEELEKDGAWEQLIHPEDLVTAVTNFNNFILGKLSTYDVEFRLKNREGNYIWVHSKAKLSKNGEGEVVRVSGSHADITDKKLAESLLLASERKYKHLFDNSLIGIMRLKASDFTIEEINRKGLQILALQAPPRHLKLQEILVDPDKASELQASLEKNNSLEEFEVKVIRWDESETWISLSAVLYEEDGETFYDIIFRDISEFKENLLELQKLNFELDNFVYHASHDIRSPLRSMIGLIDILKTERNPSETKKIVDMISGSVQRLDKFVVDLLAMSRNNRLTEPAVPINFMVEINNSVTNFHHVYTTKNLEIRLKVHQQEAFYSDLTKVRIILNNLISNAIKYRKNEDKLISYIHIYVEVSPEEAVFKIEDNGEGISDDKLEKIFEMFYRASENSEGSGLGMYIVKNVVKKLNADIKVESEEKKGTTFIVTIPNEKLVATSK